MIAIQNADYKPPIRGLSRLGLRILISLLGSIDNRIPDDEVRRMAKGLLTGGSDTLTVLSDTNPDDADQMRAVFNKLLTQGEFREGSEAELLQQVAKIGNDDARQAITFIVSESYVFAGILTDENPANAAQSVDRLRSQLQSPSGLEFISNILGIVLPGGLGESLAFLVIEAVLDLLEGEGELKADKQTVGEVKSILQRQAARMERSENLAA